MKPSQALRHRASTRRLIISRSSPSLPQAEAPYSEPSELLADPPASSPALPDSPSQEQRLYQAAYQIAWTTLAPERAYKLEEIYGLFSTSWPPARTSQELLEELVSYLAHHGIIEPSPSSHIWYLGGSTPF